MIFDVYCNVEQSSVRNGERSSTKPLYLISGELVLVKTHRFKQNSNANSCPQITVRN